MKFLPALLFLFVPAFAVATEPVDVPIPTILTVQDIVFMDTVSGDVCPDCGQIHSVVEGVVESTFQTTYSARQFRPVRSFLARVQENFQARRQFRLERRFARSQRRSGRFLSRLFFWRS